MILMDIYQSEMDKSLWVDGDLVCRKYKVNDKEYILLARDSGGKIRCYRMHANSTICEYLGKFPEGNKITKENVLKFLAA